MSVITSNTTAIPTGTWSVDPAHSKVGFAVKHMGIATVRGEFTQFEGTLEVGDDLDSLRARGTVQAASVDTNEPQRDAVTALARMPKPIVITAVASNA